MPSARVLTLTTVTMVAFASNLLFCRAALKHTGIDPASFTLIRLASGALALWLIVRLRQGGDTGRGNWLSAGTLFAYAAAFSFAYVSLPAGTGALLLFGAVQATMIGHGIWSGERLDRLQVAGLVLAIGGLVGLLLPGLTAPPLVGAVLMCAAGVAWGIYSLRGRGAGDPTMVTSGNFLRAVPMALVLVVVTIGSTRLDAEGVVLAVASRAAASGIGYAIWYTVLPWH